MIEQVSTAVKFLAFYTEAKVGKTGLTVTVDVRGHDGTEIVTAAAATEIGDGLYSYTLSGSLTASEGAYVAVFKTATTSVDLQHIPSLWCIGVAGVDRLDATVNSRAAASDLATVAGYLDTEVAAIKAKTDAIPSAGAIADAVWDEAIAGHGGAGSTGQALGAAGAASDPLLNTVPGSYASGTAGAALGRIGSGQITTTSTVSQAGDIEIVRGDDYDAADGRAFDWTDASAGWPTLTDGAISVMIGVLSFTGSVVTATGDGKKVRLELSAAQTATLRKGVQSYGVKVTVGGDVITLVNGKATVR